MGAPLRQTGDCAAAIDVVTSTARAVVDANRFRRDPSGRVRILRRRVAKNDIYRTPERDASFDAMSTALLLAESEPGTRGFLERHLADDGFQVLAAEPDALVEADGSSPDVVLLGDSSVLEACRSWNRDVPVIVLGSPGSDTVDRVRAFERGCDDYVDCPFAYEELLARIKAVLRRTSPPPRERLEAGGIVIDRATRRVTVDGRLAVLAGKEYELLCRLACDPARVFTKEELLREVWGFRSLGRTRTLDSHASRLRRKLGPGSGGPYVVNVWGVGYRLLGP
jgi:DNA-binding response OmpR family regulator